MPKLRLKPFGILAALFVALFSMDAIAVNNPVSYDDAITDCDVFKYNGEYYITGNWLATCCVRGIWRAGENESISFRGTTRAWS